MVKMDDKANWKSGAVNWKYVNESSRCFSDWPISQSDLEQIGKRSNEAEIKHARVVHDVNIVHIYDVQVEETEDTL